MQALMIILRFFHIVSGLFWVGATIMLAGFVMPAIRAAGPAGGSVMRQLAVNLKLPIYMNVAGALTILSGLGFIWQDQTLSNGAWIHSSTGIVFTTGATIALLSAIFGNVVSRPTAKKIGALGTQIAAAGGPPSAEQTTQMLALQNRLTMATNILAITLTVAATCMAIARYV